MKIVRLVGNESCRVVGLRCDRCKSDSRGHNNLVENFRTFEYLQIEFVAGYWADVLDDGNKYDCDLCEQCVKTVLGPYLRCEEDYLWRQMQRFQTSMAPSDELLQIPVDPLAWPRT